MNLYCADSGSKRTSTAQTLASKEPLLCRLGLQTNLVCRLWLQTNLYCTESGSKRISTALTLAPNESLLRWLWLQTNLYCVDSGSKRTSTALTLAPNESLLRLLWLQTNLYCANSGSKRISTVQTRAPNKSLLCRLWLQTNLYCADSGSKQIYTVQTLAPNVFIFSRWQRPCWDVFASLFYSGRKQRRVVHLFYSLCSKPLWSKWYSNLFSFQNYFKYHLLCSTEENEVKMIWWSTPLKLWPSHTNDFCWGVGLILRDSVVGPRCTLSLAVKL